MRMNQQTLAIYSRVLSPEEIRNYSKLVLASGISALANTEGLESLYPFTEGHGRMSRNIVGNHCGFLFPKARYSTLGTLFNLPRLSVDYNIFSTIDFLMNIVFFFPFGILLAMIVRIDRKSNAVCIGIVVLAAALMSFSIELIQLYSLTRFATIVDVAGNVMGAMIGALIVIKYRVNLKRT